MYIIKTKSHHFFFMQFEVNKHFINFVKDHELHEPLKVNFLKDHKLHAPLLACFTTEQSTVKASLFVK